MQTYSTIKGISNSDDGTERLPDHTVRERKTTSDDGFESFPAYSRPKAQAHDDESESFHSCEEEIQTYEDANTSFPGSYTEDAPSDHHHSTQTQEAQPVTEPTNPSTPQKKKRRRPKNKRKNRKGKGRLVEGEHNSYQSLQVEEEEEEEEEEGEDWQDSSDEEAQARVKAMVADDEEFAFRAEEVRFMGAFAAMDAEQQRREMNRLLECMILGE
jgi:hypothetical protein